MMWVADIFCYTVLRKFVDFCFSHNLHHYMCFFEVARKSIKDDNIADLINLIKFQSTFSEVDYSIKKVSKPSGNSYSGNSLFGKILW